MITKSLWVLIFFGVIVSCVSAFNLGEILGKALAVQVLTPKSKLINPCSPQ